MKTKFRHTIICLLVVSLFMSVLSVAYGATDNTSIEGCTVILDKYFVSANGIDQTPEVIEVYYTDDLGRKKTLSTAGYTVSYYKYKYTAHDSKEISSDMEQVKSCITPGEYKVVVTGKWIYEGSCEALFTIAGKPQRITIDKTKYSKNTKSEDFTLKPKTTGDGTGFTYTAGNKNVAEVSPEGVVHITGCGETSINIFTAGDVLSQPAVQILTLNVAPAKVTWKSKKSAVRNGGEASLKYNKSEGATRYQIRYSTSNSFSTETTLTKKTKKASTTLKGLKPGRTYYVKVRPLYEFTDARGNDRVIYGNWSTVKTLKK